MSPVIWERKVIMSSIGFRISTDFQRPDRSLVEGFRGLPVANIADCLNRLAAINAGLRPYNKATLLGSALTVRVPGGDNLMFYKAIELARPGDVLVIAAGGALDRALCGEIMVSYARARGLVGFVIDGCIRDSEIIAGLDFPVYAKGLSPNGPYKNGPGEIGFPVAIGGQVVCSGDILVGDPDGLLAVKPAEAAGLIEEVKAVAAKEEKMLDDIEAGLGLNLAWMEQALAAKGCQSI